MIKRIINASAGTGKTFTILEDVLKTKLEDKITVDEIKKALKDSVFLSFSKAAVEELKERIHSRLAELTAMGQKSVEDELSGFLGSKVYTIHAFSLELARIFRYELGLPASVDFMPEGDDTVWSKIVEEFYKKEYDSRVLRGKLGIKTAAENVLFDVLTILGDKYQIRKFIKAKGENVFYVHELGGKTPEMAGEKAVIQVLKKLGFDTGKSIDYEKDSGKIQDMLCEKRMVMETFERDILPLMPELSEKKEKLETCFYKLKKDGTKSLNHEKCEKRVAELESIVKPFLKKTGVLDFFEAAEMAGCILTKMACYIGRSLYLPRMMEDGVFDFDAIVFLVISLIKSKGRTWTLERMKNEGMEMKNLYIDEAQDSDIVQNYLISVLAGGDDKTLNVTVVGDIKQSIYQWRNAYPEEFRAMYDEASGLKRSETLKKSWRVKNGENLEFINKMFERMNTASGGKWDYDPARDELEPNDGRIVNGIKKKIKITRMFKDTDIKSIKSDMEAFIESGSCGILVEKKRFATQSGIMDSITGIKQRIKIENNGKDGILGTSLAERMLITSLLYSRLNDKLQFMPYLLLFTTPGNFIRAKSRQVKGATDMIDMFKKVKRYTESAYDAYRESAIAKSAYLLMNKYGLWKYMFHGDVNGPDKISLESVRRGINTMLAAMHLGEKTGDTALYSREDVVAQSLESDTSPFEWYGLPGSKAQAGDKELTTIHSSKGLEYENIIIFADIMERLKPETDFSNKEYSFLYSADFDSILTDRPEVGVRFFPYFGSTTCKVIKNYYAEADAPWKNGLDYYDKTSRKVISENLNVLYVAFTRAKDGIWIIDAPGKSRYIKEPKVDEMARELEVISGAEPVNINLPQKTAQSAVTGEVFYYELAEKVPLLEVKEDEAETSVRQIIKETVKIKFGGNCAGPYEGFDHIEIGTMAHEMVQSVLSKINDITQYQGEASGIKTNDAHEKAACEIVSSAGTIGELQKLKYIIKDKKDLRSEVPIWGIGDKGMLVKGVIDSLALTDDKVSIIEYKTVFDDGKAQKQMSKKQLELYEGMIKGLAGKRGVEKISVMLKGR